MARGALTALAWCAALALLVSGGSASYTGERLFWRAERVSAPIVKDPGRATPERFADAIAAFDRVIRKARGTAWAARAHLAVGSLYALQSQYESARGAYSLVLRDYSQLTQLCLTARVATAEAYKREQRWEDAAQVYRDISESHPWTRIGLEAPLAIATLYDQHGQPERAVEARERAVLTYLNAISMAPTPETSANAKGYLALAYHQLGDWDAAVRTLEELAAMSSGVNQPLVLLSLGSLYQAQQGHKEAAEQAFTRLASEFPEPPAATAAKTRLEHLSIQLVSN